MPPQVIFCFHRTHRHNYFLSKQISTPVRVQGLEKIRLIAVGAFHNLALSEDGMLWAWGNNEYGQLGTGDTQPRAQPIPVQGLSGLTLVCTPILNMLLFSFPANLSEYHLIKCNAIEQS